MKNILAALFILQGDSISGGGSPEDMLRYYHDGSLALSPGVSYAQKILRAAEIIRYVDMNSITEQECEALKRELEQVIR
jgi:hypothetical protein